MNPAGLYTGQSLSEAPEKHPEYLGTKMEPGMGLPNLVKFIDAKQDLSVQVLPNDQYAHIHENQNGKSEMWYFMDATEHASLIYGFEYQVTAELLRFAVAEDLLDKHL